MKKHLSLISLFAVFFFIAAIFYNYLDKGLGNTSNKDSKKIVFAISPDYYPFEYTENGKLKGLEIDLARLLAEKIGRNAEFVEIGFDSIFLLIDNGTADAAIASIGRTPSRIKKFDTSIPYIDDSISLVFKKNNPVDNLNQLVNKKISCQLGSFGEQWAKENLKSSKIYSVDNAEQSFELLRAQRVDVIVTSDIQAKVYKAKNEDLGFFNIEDSSNSSVIFFKRGSKLKSEIDIAIDFLKKSGEIQKLRNKYGLSD